MANDFLIEIQSPDDVWTDVTDRVDLEQLGGYSYGIEDSLLQFRAGDLTLLLDDTDGGASALFSGADPAQTYRLRVYRNDAKLFEGVLAIPGQAKTSANEASLELNAFGYLSLLDQLTAEPIRRTFTAATASITTGTSTITFSPSKPSALSQGDVIRFYTDIDSEELTIVDMPPAAPTTAVISGTAGRTWSAGSTFEVSTPYYRRKTIPFLVGQLFAAAGIPNPTVDLVGSDFDLPVGTPLNTDSLPSGSNAASISVINGILRMKLTNTNRDEWEATDPISGGWTLVSNANKIGNGSIYPRSELLDWQVYDTVEPAANVADVRFEQTSSVNHNTLHGGIDYDSGYAFPPGMYGLRASTNVNPQFDIQRFTWNPFAGGGGSGTFAAQTSVPIDVQTAPAQGGSVLISDGGCDYDSIRDLVYYSYTVVGGTDKLGTYVGATTAFADFKTGAGAGGQLRYNRIADVMLHYSGTVVTGYRNAAMLFSADVGTTKLRMRTVHYLETAKAWVGVILEKDRTKLLVANADFSQSQVIDFSSTASSTTDPAGVGADRILDPNNHLAYYTHDTLVGRIDGQYVVVATLYAGVVVYADFSGRTVAGALTELAKLCNCIAYVDQDYNGYFVSRNSLAVTQDVKPLDDLILTQEEDVVWEKWFGRIQVNVGAAVITLGDPSGSEAVIDIDANFDPLESVGFTLAAAYRAFYSRARRSRRLTLDDDETVYLPYQRVRIGPEEWAILETDYHWTDREVAVRLIEAI